MDVLIYIPFDSFNQAKQIGDKLLQDGLVFVYRVYKDVYQAWKTDKGEYGDAEICVLRLRAPKERVNKIYKEVKSIHPWPVFCFEVVELAKGSY